MIVENANESAAPHNNSGREGDVTKLEPVDLQKLRRLFVEIANQRTPNEPVTISEWHLKLRPALEIWRNLM